MSRIIPPLCALLVGSFGPACGVSQSRYDTLLKRTHGLESRAKQAEGALETARRAHRYRVRRHPARRSAARPPVCRPDRRSPVTPWQLRLRQCQKKLRATHPPLVLTSHTREQNIGRGRRRASTVTLMPGTVILPVSGRRSLRKQRARRAEQSLRRAIARQLSTLADCYHRRVAIRLRPATGAVSFAFEVTRTGRTRRVSVVHRLLQDMVTVRCALRGLRRLRLPRQRYALWAVFPLEFYAGKHYAAPPIPPRP